MHESRFCAFYSQLLDQIKAQAETIQKQSELIASLQEQLGCHDNS